MSALVTHVTHDGNRGDFDFQNPLSSPLIRNFTFQNGRKLVKSVAHSLLYVNQKVQKVWLSYDKTISAFTKKRGKVLDCGGLVLC